MALDAQGPERVRPFAEHAGATFPTVVDRDNTLSRRYGFKAVPNLLLIDAEGVLKYRMYGGFDIGRPEMRRFVEEWAYNGSTKGGEDESETADFSQHLQASDLFQQGMELYREGRTEKALALWRQGVSLEPDNYVIRKQIWAVENPERFYQGEVDYDWQREQLDRGL